MRVETICSKMGLETDKSYDTGDMQGSLFLDIVKLKSDLE